MRIYVLVFLIFCPWANSAENSAATLKLFIWESYIPEELLVAFEEKEGIKVEQVFYETDELKNETLIQTNGGEGLDLVVGSRTSFKTYQKLGWLREFDNEKFPNLKHINEKWLAKESLKNLSVPYLWGTVGIAFRKDKVTEPIQKWSDVFAPSPDLKNKIMMINDSRDTLSLALKSLGKSINSTSTEDLKAAEALLLKQRPFVKTYSYPELNEKSMLVTGDIWVSMIYNGDALYLHELNKNIDFVVPADGTNLWVDDIGVLKTSKHPEAAWKLVNFIHEPKNAAKIAQFLYYATPNQTAYDYLKEEFREDTRIHPSQETLSRSEFFAELSAKQLKQRNDIFLKVIK